MNLLHIYKHEMILLQLVAIAGTIVDNSKIANKEVHVGKTPH